VSRYLGREKLVALGFQQIGKLTFSLQRGCEEGRITLDRRGYVRKSSGFPVDAEGIPMLRQR
jgi:hypothetical protein